LTLAEKTLLGHLDDPQHQDLTPGKSYLLLRPDRVIFQDVLGQTGMLQFMQSRRERVAVPTTIHCDHLIQARHEAGQESAGVARRARRKFTNSCSGQPRNTTSASGGPVPASFIRFVLENYAFPGKLIIGTDSHTPNAGGLGSCAVGLEAPMRWR